MAVAVLVLLLPQQPVRRGEVTARIRRPLGGGVPAALLLLRRRAPLVHADRGHLRTRSTAGLPTARRCGT